MYTQVKSSSGISLVPIETRFISERKLFIFGKISDSLAFEFYKQVSLLNTESSERIDVYINSPGGDVNAGFLIYDVMRSSRAPIRTFCLGHAYSMAAVIFSSANSGRYMMEHSLLMLHEPLIGNSNLQGNCSSIKSISETLVNVKRKINKVIAKNTGKTLKTVEKEIGPENHFFDFEAAYKFGLCDGLYDKTMFNDMGVL